MPRANKPGRPAKYDNLTVLAVIRHRESNLSIREIARELSLSATTVHRILDSLKPAEPR